MANHRSSDRTSALPVIVFTLTHLLVVSIAALVLVWLMRFREGFAFTSQIKAKIFNSSSSITNSISRICTRYIPGSACLPSAYSGFRVCNTRKNRSMACFFWRRYLFHGDRECRDGINRKVLFPTLEAWPRSAYRQLYRTVTATFGDNVMITYKLIPGSRQVLKRSRLRLQLIALAAEILGVYAVFKFHNELHMNTLRSWIGLSTICLIGFQSQSSSGKDCKLLLGFKLTEGSPNRTSFEAARDNETSGNAKDRSRRGDSEKEFRFEGDISGFLGLSLRNSSARH
ncbi:cytochrome b561, eukaryote [Cynara cardunculus var. scolymus]|uniref:Cytochrome b561, eukaryote n=1 Tax=Cynara cardunculus var. scolymus TaxID=59895 RepID=A0A103XV47_CYNCS|nr:cytochrome b561, eukaryote [Cynara cardunculus var. scolymus]